MGLKANEREVPCTVTRAARPPQPGLPRKDPFQAVLTWSAFLAPPWLASGHGQAWHREGAGGAALWPLKETARPQWSPHRHTQA